MANVNEFFNTELPAKLASSTDLVDEIGASYVFDIDGAGQWTVDLTEAPGKVSEGAIDDPGCVVTISKDDFETLLDDPMQGMMLFTMGKLQVTNVGLALSLQKLLS